MILKWKCKIYVNYYTFQFLEHLWTISLIAQQKYLLIYAEEMRLYCGLCLLPSTVNWARWTVNSIYCVPPSLGAGIHQDLGYGYLGRLQNKSYYYGGDAGVSICPTKYEIVCQWFWGILKLSVMVLAKNCLSVFP